MFQASVTFMFVVLTLFLGLEIKQRYEADLILGTKIIQMQSDMDGVDARSFADRERLDALIESRVNPK
jgi:hypothetical protein